MQHFPDIFQYITGAFPNATARAASGQGAKDGTEFKTRSVNNFWLGWVQRLFVLTGKTTDGTVESSSASQIVDMMHIVGERKETVNINSTQTHSPTDKSRLYKVNTSGGIVTLTVGAGNFVGQKILIQCAGTNLAYVKGTGFYLGASSLGTPISNGRSVSATWDGAKWEVEDSVSSFIESGGVTTEQTTKGRMKHVSFVNIPSVSSESRSYTFNFPVPFLNTNRVNPNGVLLEFVGGSQFFNLAFIDIVTTSQAIYTYLKSRDGNAVSGNVDSVNSAEGPY